MLYLLRKRFLQNSPSELINILKWFFLYIIKNLKRFIGVRGKHWKMPGKQCFTISRSDASISEMVVATCVVSARRILSSFRPIVYRKPLLDPISRFPVIENSADFFFLNLNRQIFGFSICSVGYTPRPICMQIFKSPALLEVP